MTDDGTNGKTTPEDEGIDLVALVGKVLDERGLTADRLTSLDSLGGLDDRIKTLFTEALGSNAGGASNASAPAFDEEGFMAKVGALVDERLKGFTPTSPEKKEPVMRRWLRGGTADA